MPVSTGIPFLPINTFEGIAMRSYRLLAISISIVLAALTASLAVILHQPQEASPPGNIGPSNSLVDSSPVPANGSSSLEKAAVKAAQTYLSTGGDLEKANSHLRSVQSKDAAELERARLTGQAELDKSQGAIVAARLIVDGQTLKIAPDLEEAAAMAASIYAQSIDAEKTTEYMSEFIRSKDRAELERALAAAKAVIAKEKLVGVTFSIKGDTIVCDNSEAMKSAYRPQVKAEDIALMKTVCPSISTDPKVFAYQEGPCQAAITAAALLDEEGYSPERVNQELEKMLTDTSEWSGQPRPDANTLKIMQEAAQLRLKKGKLAKDAKVQIQKGTLVFALDCQGPCG